MSLTEQILAQLPGTLAQLQNADRLWSQYRSGTLPVTPVVTSAEQPLESVEWDVVICGGTLGILMGAALVQRGWRVAVLERGILRGRDQEWNISRQELQVLLTLELLTPEELETAIATQYNPARLSFHKGIELWVEDVLNIGVDPVYLLERLKAKFLAAGGQLFEQVVFEGAIVHSNGVNVQVNSLVNSSQHESVNNSNTNLSSTLTTFKTRLLLDAMGHFSPISRQARQGHKPDAVCLVVGSCATGYSQNDTGDLFASFTPIQNQCQYFWEAFPARDGRTTYLFTYLDAHPDRPSLADLFEDYLRLLPDYQQVDLAQLTFKRALFGFFPCYRQSPLKPAWNRILPIGDSSGSQSPLSFGGFGSMMRHLQRLTDGIHEALEQDLLYRTAIAPLQPYQPNLAVTWLFQRSMSVGMNQTIAPDQINQLLSSVFQEMEGLGDRVLKPFLQDVVQFPALFQTLLKVSLHHPALVAQIIPQVGLLTLLDWMRHYVNLGIYAGLYRFVSQQVQHSERAPSQQYARHRWLDALKYGSGNDWHSQDSQ
ncbi:MAG: FAD-binding oxidoreductase [Oculatellaceae cyanobacterium Prado106]|jgi:lycopene cyclase CruP|nr:FAD-binding oxidoreductase [Oculatellaceae cyanobacterium Prado106]